MLLLNITHLFICSHQNILENNPGMIQLLGGFQGKGLYWIYMGVLYTSSEWSISLYGLWINCMFTASCYCSCRIFSKGQFYGYPAHHIKREHCGYFGKKKLSHGDLGSYSVAKWWLVCCHIFVTCRASLMAPWWIFLCLWDLSCFYCMKSKIVTSVESGSYSMTICGKTNWLF